MRFNNDEVLINNDPSEMKRVEAEELTNFHSDAATERATFLRPIAGIPDLIQNVSDGQNHSIESFLERPLLLSTGVWTAASAANATLYTCNNVFSTVLLNNKVYSQKVFGFLGFRATTVLRLQVNGNKFQQGRLIMDYTPVEATDINRRLNLVRRTQLPHVEFDLATQTEVVMEIPYISHELAFSTRGVNTFVTNGDIGDISVAVYSPLATGPGGQTSADWSLWIQFKDIELLYPTFSDSTIVPQSGTKRKYRKNVITGKEVQEIEQEYTGPVSSVAHTVSKAATIMGEIPLLSSIAQPVSWFSAFVAKTAHSFGFSKPVNNNKVTKISQIPLSFMNNVDGEDTSVMLAGTSNNHLEILPGFAGSDIDAMSFSYIKQKPAFLTSFSWPTSSAPYDVLYTGYGMPTLYGTDRVIGIAATVVTDFTPLGYLSNFFQYYRGSVGFRFKFVKTGFHSGRLAFIWTPSQLNGAFAINATSFPYLHKEVVDIRDVDEVTVACPWGNTSLYSPVNESYGVLRVVVVNELRAPETASGSINVIVEVFGLEDFEYACPTVVRALPTAQSGSKMTYRGDVSSSSVIRSNVDEVKVAHGIGSADAKEKTMYPARTAIGEHIDSLRQLMKRFVPYWYLDGSSLVDATTYDNEIYPYACRMCVVNDTTGAVLYPLSRGADYFSFFTPCYGFYRGGVRIKVAQNEITPKTNYRAWYDTTSGGTSQSTVNDTISADVSTRLQAILPFSMFCDSAINPFLEVSVPFYYRSFACKSVTDSPTGTSLTNVSTNRPRCHLAIRAKGKFSATVYRSVSDDFDMGLWLTPPGLIRSPSLLTNRGQFTI